MFLASASLEQEAEPRRYLRWPVQWLTSRIDCIRFCISMVRPLTAKGDDSAVGLKPAPRSLLRLSRTRNLRKCQVEIRQPATSLVRWHSSAFNSIMMSGRNLINKPAFGRRCEGDEISGLGHDKAQGARFTSNLPVCTVRGVVLRGGHCHCILSATGDDRYRM